MSRVFAGPTPRIFGHRGAAGIVPENTLPSLSRAVADGAEILEIDVQLTRDGEPVVIHDDTLDRTTDGHGPVAEHTLADVKRMDAGVHFTLDAGTTYPFRGRGIRVPSLEEALAAFPQVPFNMEVKSHDPRVIDATLAAIAHTGARDRVLLAAAHPDVMRRIRPAARDMPTSFSSADVVEFFQWLGAGRPAGYTAPAPALQIPTSYEGMELVTPESIAAAHSLGVEVHVWTVNEEEEIERLLDLGVDGLMSDFPLRVLRAVERRRLGAEG